MYAKIYVSHGFRFFSELYLFCFKIKFCKRIKINNVAIKIFCNIKKVT